MIISWLERFARACESPISKLATFLYLAACCTVLRSRWCQSGINRGTQQLHDPARSTLPKCAEHLLGYASITMTLDRYSHWIPSMGRHAADGMNEALG
jgi:hypothetical protein